MFPNCSHCFTGFRTHFVFSVAQLLPMVVVFFGFNGKMAKINKMAKKSVSMEVLGGYLYWKIKPPFRHFGNHFGPRKSDFWPFYLFWSFSHWNSHWSRKNLPPWEGVELQRKQNVFWDQWSSGNNLGTCTKGASEIFENKNHPNKVMVTDRVSDLGPKNIGIENVVDWFELRVSNSSSPAAEQRKYCTATFATSLLLYNCNSSIQKGICCLCHPCQLCWHQHCCLYS